MFDENRYFDVEITYAKAAPDDILMQIVAVNCGSEAAPLHVLPQFWARNIWSRKPGLEKPVLRRDGDAAIQALHPNRPAMPLVCDGTPELLFCDNESNLGRIWSRPRPDFFKDGINGYVVDGRYGVVNPDGCGTKAAAHYRAIVPASGQVRLRLRLIQAEAEAGLDDFDAILAQRRAEADAFYAALQADIRDPDARLVQR